VRSIIIVLSLGLIACNTRESIHSLGEYDVPVDSVGTEKKYTYVRLPDSTLIVTHYRYTTTNGKYFFKKLIYVNEELSSESYWSINGDKKSLVEEYSYEAPDETSEKPERIKAEIIKFDEIENEKKYAGLDLELSYTNSIGFKTIMSEKTSYAGDTTFLWNEQSLNTLKFSYSTFTSKRLKFIPFRSDDFEWKGYCYYAKGIGPICWVLSDDYDRYEVRLLSIEQIK
jgi:hypothetical protein